MTPEVDGTPLLRATLTVAAVARRLGVAPATLRTWDRRYGLGPSQHEAGSHRRYSSSDVKRLLVMRRLTLEGVAPAEAAKVALGTPVDDDGPPLSLLSPRQHVRDGDALARRGPLAPPAAPDEAHRVPPRPSLRLEGSVAPTEAMPVERAIRGLSRAATTLDPDECRRIIARQIERTGVVQTWTTVIAPVLGMMGDRWEATGEGVETEHLLSETVTDVLREAARGLRHPRNTRPVVLAAAPEEHHGLPIHVLAAALAERGIGVRLFGVRVPTEALAAAVRRVGPTVVFVYAHLPVVAAGQIAELPRLRPAPLVLLGGPGWEGVSTPAGAERVDDLAGAVARIERAVGL